MNRTKIIATVGPSCQSAKVLGKLIDSGVSVFRLNTKHNEPEWHSSMIDLLKEIAKRKNAKIGIIMDLQGPEICIGFFKEGQIILNDRERILITHEGNLGDRSRIILNDKKVLQSIKPGQQFYMDDGNLKFKAVSKSKKGIVAEAVRGGILFDRRSVNLPGLNIDMPVLAKADMRYIDLGIRKVVDFFAVSFVRDKKDVEYVRKIIEKKKGRIRLISKIERDLAIKNFSGILESSDAIMIGRGDLGVEIPVALVPLVQKDLIQKSRQAGKPVITATQMLESMIKSRMPTRAEVSDVANAILDGTDAIMLSAESATGKYPVEAVRMMAEIDMTVQNGMIKPSSLPHRMPVNLIEAISQAVDTLSTNPLNFKAIVLLTETGRTARMIARFRPEQPIYAFTKNPNVANRLGLVWGVQPDVVKFNHKDNERIFSEIIARLKSRNKLSKGDNVICVSGQIVGKENLVNSIVINKVE